MAVANNFSTAPGVGCAHRPQPHDGVQMLRASWCGAAGSTNSPLDLASANHLRLKPVVVADPCTLACIPKGPACENGASKCSMAVGLWIIRHRLSPQGCSSKRRWPQANQKLAPPRVANSHHRTPREAVTEHTQRFVAKPWQSTPPFVTMPAPATPAT